MAVTAATAVALAENVNPLTPVSVRLGWLANANSAGTIVALANGYYREEGLEVSLHEGGLIDPSVKTVAAGADDLGFANSPDLVIAARAAGAPLKIVAVIHKEGYHGFFVRTDSAIKTPQDWEGRRVGIKVGSPTLLYYQAILSKLSINRAAIHEIPLGVGLQAFLAGEIDVYPGAVNNEALSLEAHGVKVRILEPAQYGIPTMGNVLFVSERTSTERAGMVRGFVRATMRGWDWCRHPENLEAAVDRLLAFNPKLDRSKERQGLILTLPLVGNGSIDRHRLTAIIENQARFVGLPRLVSVEEMVDTSLLQLP